MPGRTAVRHGRAVGRRGIPCAPWFPPCRRAAHRTSSSARCSTGSARSTSCRPRPAPPRPGARSCTPCWSGCSTCRPTSAPRRPRRRCWRPQWEALVEQEPELAEMIASDEQAHRGQLVRRRPGAHRDLVHPRGPHPARARRARALRRDRRRRPGAARLRRPPRRRGRRRDAGRRLQDRPVPERAVRGQGAVPDEVLRAGAVAAARRDPAAAPAGLPRQRRGGPLLPRRARPARASSATSRRCGRPSSARPTTGDWRPKTSKLCDWCDYREFCPAWGGTPPPLPENAALHRARPGHLRSGRAGRRLTGHRRTTSAGPAAAGPRRLGTCTAPTVSGTGTTCGTARVGTPAATAERTPVGESSMATQSRTSTPSARAAAR